MSWRNLLRCGLLVCVVGGLCSASAAHAQGKKYALVVGVETYDPKFFHRLPYTVDDAEDLAAALGKHQFDVTVMVPEAPIPERKPSTAKKIVDQLTRRLKGLTADDTVVVALSGHGLQFKTPRKLADGSEDTQFFCPEDADPTDVNSLVSLGKVYAAVEQCLAGRKLLIVDACRNEVLTENAKSRREIELDPVGLKPRTVPKGMLALYSCSEGEKSYEHPDVKHGVFSYHVIQYLQGTADPRFYVRDQVSVRGLADYASRETRDFVFAKLSADQLPELVGRTSDWPLGSLKSAKPPALVAPFSAAAAKASQEAWAKYLGKPVIERNSLGMDLVLLPPGTYRRGSTGAQIDAVLKFDSSAKRENFADEQPQHTVQLTQPFRLGATEVTVGQFRRFVTATGYQTEAEKDGEGGFGWNATTEKFEGRKPEYTWKNTGFLQTDNHPVVNVSWNDAQAFVEWLSRDEGLTYRLPTEAQWEYACRAGTTGLWWHGDDPEGLGNSGNVADGTGKARWGKNYANFSYIAARDGDAFTATVGRSSRTNPFGLSDMHGNVLEWCGDWYDAEFYGKTTGTAVDPFNASPADFRVLRGGSWNGSARNARSAFRNWSTPDYRYSFIGFRVSRTQ